MKSTTAYFGFAPAVLFALTQPISAQGTSGGTGAVASIPGSVVRGHEQGPGLVSIITGSTLPSSNSNSNRRPARPGEVEYREKNRK